MEQQNVQPSEATETAPEHSPPLRVSNEFPSSALDALHAELDAQQEIEGGKPTTGRVAKKGYLLVALVLACVIVAKAIAVLRESQSVEAEENLETPTEEPMPEKGIGEKGPTLEEEHLLAQKPTQGPGEGPYEGRPITHGQKTRKEYGPEQTSPSAPFGTPQVQPTVEQAEKGKKGKGAARKERKGKEKKNDVGGRKEAKDKKKAGVKQPSLPSGPPGAGPAAEDSQSSGRESYGKGSAEVGDVHPEIVSEQPHDIPGSGDAMATEEDATLQELRDQRSVISRLKDVATWLAGELCVEEASEILNKFNSNMGAAEQAEMAYDSAISQSDPNIATTRDETIKLIRASLEGARGALISLAALAKLHAEAVQAYCSASLHFTDVESLRERLQDSSDATSVTLAIRTLGSVETTSKTLQREIDEQVRLLKSATFTAECEANAFIEISSAAAAVNSRKATLERLAALDKALTCDILEMYKVWIVSKLQDSRIPLGMESNLVWGLHKLLSETRRASEGQSASGITDADVQGMKEMFTLQLQEMDAINSAQGFEEALAAFERAKALSQPIRSTLQLHKEAIQETLEHKPLSKKEASSASDVLGEIAHTAVKSSEEFLDFTKTVCAELGDKSGVKLLLRKLSSRIKTGTGEQVEDGARADICIVAVVKKHFSEPKRQLQALLKELLSRAQEINGLVKKGRKYKLDKEGIGSSALDQKTEHRLEVATRKRQVALLRMRFQYLFLLAMELEELENAVNVIFDSPLRKTTDGWAELERLKDEFTSEKSVLMGAEKHTVIPESFDKMLQIASKIQSVFEKERLEQLKEAVNCPCDDP